jgi:two-component system NtrC family response regulator
VPRILFVDDDTDFSPLLSAALEGHGHQVRHLPGAEEALELLSRQPPPDLEVVLLDQLMPRMDGLEFLGELRRRGIRLPVLLFTGWDAADVAIRASRLGAFRYLPKPGDLEPASLAPLLREIGVAAQLARRAAGAGARPVRDEDVLLGKSEPMRAVHWRIGGAAGHDRPVLLVGEVGTGKGRAAQAVHRYSARADRPLLHVNCLAFADEAGLDDRLFGCEPGRPGVFEQADGGAVLLDHFHRLGVPAQARLAELIRDRVVYRTGRGTAPRPVQARVLACSSEDLPAALAEGRLYWELYSLLEATTITLPPLRERGDDVLLLAEHFVRQLAAPLGRPAQALDAQARQCLLAHRWPGNVRELQGVIGRAVQSCRGAEIIPDDLGLDLSAPGRRPSQGGPPGAGRGLPLSRERAYRAYLDALRREPALAGGADAVVFRWLKCDPDGSEGLPASCETFQRYLRQARAFYDDRRNTPRAGRQLGRSVVRREDL